MIHGPENNADQSPSLASPESLRLFQALVSSIIRQAPHKVHLQDGVRVDFLDASTSIILERGAFTEILPFGEAVMVRVEKVIGEKDGIVTELHKKYAFSSQTGETAYEEEVEDYFEGKKLRSEKVQEIITALPDSGAEFMAVFEGLLPRELAGEETQRVLELADRNREESRPGRSVLTSEHVIEVMDELLKLDPSNAMEIEVSDQELKLIEEFVGEYFDILDEERPN